MCMTCFLCLLLQMLVKGIRSFSPDNNHVIEFYKPLTLIVGSNGAGKTVRCMACTACLLPSSVFCRVCLVAAIASQILELVVQDIEQRKMMGNRCTCCCMANAAHKDMMWCMYYSSWAASSYLHPSTEVMCCCCCWCMGCAAHCCRLS
jgi:hypothetical protein